jgi:hypothetical protein
MNFQILKNIPQKLKVKMSDDIKKKFDKTKSKQKEFNKFLANGQYGLIGYFSTIDEEGNECRVIMKSEDILKYSNKKNVPEEKVIKTFKFEKKETLNLGEYLKLCPTDYNIIYKCKCSNCDNEYLLFDSRLHGNDAVEDKAELNEYEYKLKKVDGNFEPKKIRITIRNDWDFDDVESNGNPDIATNDYADMISSIRIDAISEGKKVKVYNEELG